MGSCRIIDGASGGVTSTTTTTTLPPSASVDPTHWRRRAAAHSVSSLALNVQRGPRIADWGTGPTTFATFSAAAAAPASASFAVSSLWGRVAAMPAPVSSAEDAAGYVDSSLGSGSDGTGAEAEDHASSTTRSGRLHSRPPSAAASASSDPMVTDRPLHISLSNGEGAVPMRGTSGRLMSSLQIALGDEAVTVIFGGLQ